MEEQGVSFRKKKGSRRGLLRDRADGQLHGEAPGIQRA